MAEVTQRTPQQAAEARLREQLPGASVSEVLKNSQLERWVVTSGRTSKTIASGPTPREAVDRALMLFGVQR